MSPSNLIFILGVFLFSFLALGWLRKGGISFIFRIIDSCRKLSNNQPSIIAFLRKGIVGFGVLVGMFFLGIGLKETSAQTIQTYTTPGSQSFVVPLGVNSISADVWGAGGGGGGTSSGNANKGGGGGGGGYRSNSSIPVTPGETLTIIVGLGGNGGNNANGIGGGFSRILRGGTILIAVDGGNGGIRNGVGGTGGAGDVSGGNGGNGSVGGGGLSGAGGNGGNGGNGGPSLGTGIHANGNDGQGPGGGGGGSRSSGNNGSRTGGNGANGQVRLTYTPLPYLSQILSADFGSSTWCPGETRDVTVTIRNVGTATWTNSSPDINIGVKWNTNGTSWNDFNVRTNANNLASGDTRVYTLTIQASDNVGGVYGSPLAAGTNNLTFDVVNEGNFWFRNNGSSVFTTPNISISSSLSGLSYTNNSPTYCANTAITANNPSISTGVAISYSVAPALPAGLTLNTSTGQITGTPTTLAGIPAANYAVTATNSCGNNTQRVLNITISPAAPSGLNYTNNTVTYCAGSPISPNLPSFGGGGPATSFSVSPALPAGLSLNTSTGLISGTPTTLTGVAAANYTVTASNSCGNTTRQLNITIAQVADINDISQIACSGTGFSVTLANGTNGTIPAGTTYTWTAPTAPNGFITGGAAGSGSSITGTLVNTSNIARPVVYTVTPITNGCPSDPFLVNVLVNPTAAINPITSEVCTDDAFSISPVNGTNGLVPASTSYTWTVPTVTGGITGGLAGSGTSISGTLRNTGNTPQTATYTVTPITGSCVGSPFTLTVTVNPEPALTAISTAVCSNQTFSVTPSNGTNGLVPAGTTYSWSAPTVPAGVTGGIAGSGSSITGTLTNSTNTPQTATYTVTPTSGSCVGNTFTVSVAVNPIPVIPTQTATICSEDAFTVSPVNGGSTIVPAGTTYTWTVVDNPNVTGESAQPSAQPNISQTLSNTSPLPQVVIYTVTPTSGAAGNCPGAPFTVSVTVNPNPVLDSPTLVSRCSGVSTG